MLCVYLLGRFRILYNGAPYAFRVRPKTLPLWAYLLVHRDERLLRETVAFTLWPDVEERESMANLRRHLHHLQRALPEPPGEQAWLLIDRKTLRWNPEAPYWLDLAAFEQASRDAATLKDAVELYTGDLLEGIYDDWLYFERERLREIYLGALDQLLRHARARQEYPQALIYARELLNRDPLREDALRQIMSIEYERGNRAGALAEYERCTQRLRAELDVAPMPETSALYARIVRGQPLHQVAPPGKPALARRDDVLVLSLPFVGREDVLRQLHTRWLDAAHGHGTVVFIGGEAGVGKTRLLAEFAAQILQDDGRVFQSSMRDREYRPYQALVTALEARQPLLAALDVPSLWLSALLPVLPDLKERRSDLVPLPPLAPDQERERFFEAIFRTLAMLASPRPLLLILDNVHRAGDATLALLESLARRLAHHGILVLISYCEEETPRQHPLYSLRARLEQERLSHHYKLSRLSPLAISTLVRQLAGPGEDVERLADALFTYSEGNPLFLRELANDWLESGLITQEAGRWMVGDLTPSALPGGVSAVITRRLARLPTAARALAELGATIGRTFDVELIREISGWDEGAILDALDVLLDHRLVCEGVGGRSDYLFTHSLIQTTLYASLPPQVRRRRHRRIAQVIEEIDPQRRTTLASTLASHYERGGLKAQAAEAYLLAAQHAYSLHAAEEALGLADRGLGLAERPQHRFDLLALREDVVHCRGAREQQRADLDAMWEIATREHDPILRCRVLSREIRLQDVLGARQRQAALVADLKTLAAELQDSHWQAEAALAGARYALNTGSFEAAQAQLSEAARCCREKDDRAGLAQVCVLQAELATQQGHFEKVLPLVEQARALAKPEGNYQIIFSTLWVAAQAAFMQQALKTSTELAQEALELCRQAGYRQGEANIRRLLGAIYGRLMQVERALEHYREAEMLFEVLGQPQGRAAILLNRGILMVRVGRFQEGMTAFRQAEGLFDALQDLRGRVLCALALSAAALFAGDLHAAQDAASAALSLASEMGSVPLQATALANLGEAERGLGDLEASVAHLEQAVTLRRSAEDQPSDLGHDLGQLALAYLHRGDLEAARETGDALATLLAEHPDAVIHPQHLYWTVARVYHALDVPGRAHDLLARSYEHLEKEAGSIGDPALREEFWHHPLNCEIVAAHDQGRWPT